MKLDLAKATTQQIQVIQGKYPVACTRYLVALWHVGERRWLIRRHQFEDREYAERHAAELCQARNSHTHWCIIKIELPGAKI